jgi:type IV pilus assembly protein PilY1
MPTKPFMRLLRVASSVLGLALGCGLAGQAAAQSSDIDIYAGISASTATPNVLFVLDSSANWATNIAGAANCYYRTNGVLTASGPVDQGTKLAIEQCALYNLIDALPVASSGGADADQLFNVAILLMNETPKDGAYPRKRFIPLTTNNKTILKTLVSSLSKNGDKGSNADFGQSLYEAYLYYKGLAPLNGKQTSKYDSAAFSGTNYVSPSADSCSRNHIIVIGNGSPQNSNPEKAVEGLMAARIDADLATLSAAARTALKAKILNAALGNDAANWSDEMARFMRQVDVSNKLDTQGIVTHAIAVKKGASDGNFPALMNSIASYGGGSYFEATTADGLLLALGKIFNQIKAENSVFASASLPVAVNARGTYLNQVYMGVFRPDADAKPRWRGNLKQYKFGLDDADNLRLVDPTGDPVISGATGFFKPSAVSYWTSSSSFWANELMGTPPSASDSADGEVVEKGAVAQRLRTTYATTQTERKVFTCIGCAGGTTLGSATTTQLTDENTEVTQSMLGVSTAADRTALINWMRGENNAGEIGPTTPSGITVRPSIHGDVLHSRPAVLNYGGSTGVVVFYGSNDGQLRAINGNQSGTGAGEELWSFVAQEHLLKLARLRSNAPQIRLSTTPASLASTPEIERPKARDYFVDGPIGVYLKRDGSGGVDRAIIVVGMRRGGQFLYALDVTNPAAPKFLWKVSNTSSGMALLGQTWSEPRVVKIRGVSDPVVIFGGGYDAAAEDGGATQTMGNAVFVLNAVTGALVRTFTTLNATGSGPASAVARPVVADVTLVDTDYDGRIDRGYAVDLGGNIYRIDFESHDTEGWWDHTTPSNWTMYKLADLSGGTTTGRKFFYPPDVILTRDFAALMIGSGDREKPLLSATQDHFFQVFDRRLGKGAPSLHTPITFSSLAAMGTSSSAAGSGCYMAMAQGEKVVNGAASLGGTTYFGTNAPGGASASNMCSANLGVARNYAMPLFCVATTGSVIAGGGLPPSPVAGIVSVTRSNGTVTQVPFVIGAPNAQKSAIEVQRLRPTLDTVRKRTYWYHEVKR